MSDVRLSNASPTLERGVGVGDARPAEPAKPSVCRNLFGNFDRDGFEKDRRATMRTVQRAFVERWDYDPVADHPLSSRGHEWEAVESPPEFYVRPAHKRPRAHGKVDPTGGDHRPEPGEDERPPNREPVQGSRKRRARPLDGCSSSCQTKHSMSDEDEDGEQPNPLGFPTLTLAEQTPRKPESQTNSKWPQFFSPSVELADAVNIFDPVAAPEEDKDYGLDVDSASGTSSWPSGDLPPEKPHRFADLSREIMGEATAIKGIAMPPPPPAPELDDMQGDYFRPPSLS
ncbi:unnamed protein product [Lota lota]